MSDTPAAAPGAGAPDGLLQSLQAVWHDLPGLLSDRVELLSLELQRAMLALAQVAVLLVAAAVLGVTAWLALWALLIQLLVMLGLHWALALLFALAVNVGTAWWALLRARVLLDRVGLPATRRHLTIRSPSPPDGRVAPHASA